MANEYGSGGGMYVELAGPFANSGGNVIFTTVTLPAANWKNGESPYFQEVSVPYVSTMSMVNIHPSPEQLKGMSTIFLARNDNGTITVFAIGKKPERDYTFQVSVTDGLNASVILGLPAGQNVSQFSAEQMGIDVGVKTVNGDAPDEFGNVNVSTGFNGTINGVKPDSEGNIDLTDSFLKTIHEELLMGTDITIARDGQTVTITETIGDSTYEIAMILDDADYPISMTVNGSEVSVNWSGF